MQSRTRISAANLTVPKKPDSAVPERRSSTEKTGLFERLSRLQANCGTNRNDMAIALITACIAEGVNTRPQIVGVLGALDLNKRHAAMMVNNNAGNNPARHLWRVDADGIYELLA